MRAIPIPLLTLLAASATALAVPQEPPQAPRRVLVEGRRAALELWREGGVPRYRVELPDGRRSGARDARHELALRRARFDPLADAPEFAGSRFGAGSAYRGRVHLVQFVTPVLEAYREVLAELGVEVLRPVPYQALLVRAVLSSGP